mmetsp:Transcript_5310/g.8155  ORF Transcript_5310/g.8155 Transcript_5310/m.8155 type:complete len:320 (-) Transcript_5310:142-1101(-)|eukprot:CAMPEP_0178913330 /NCGR_PEP_ID=MMETSP0786-20121207/10782_1 /TAXON_ID=186022 /ORGANISM="Thalassionema frauenfeldii, Strain CCMP 1798" /LENGTH=319 /DNA_ID=CAMNT_0020586059 /DNA_START=205 /DNA_END=1164 /DNA_ORIENTATION=+
MAYRNSHRLGEEQRGFVQRLAAKMRNPFVLVALGLVAFLSVTSDASKFFTLFQTERDIRYAGRLPNSLLTVNYPYTLMRGVVQEQPVTPETDVPFFWHPHKRDRRIVRKAVTSCYGIEVIELESLDAIKKAKEVDLAARQGGNFALTSPYLREVAELFSPAHLGRASCYFRHPLDYDLFDGRPTYELKDNWLVRFLLNDGTTILDFRELGFAKQIVREVCVASPMDKIAVTIKRYADYMGWELKGSEDCVEDAVEEEEVEPKVLDHHSEEWLEFYKDNKYDCQLYEFSQQTWRAQIQTIIPLSLQVKRAKGSEEEEEEE